ncbi:uncharacterized protein EAF01_010157 [Botrytis porri]|uniref:NADP-dependent oxidoreductase domain-containing protein n=1 Tax=Botrytis porri TaxID=87229 RepID=A0A4Z1L0L0_9HELO|nr:uncharacterized protein EAF01_010157 [Botrytis porri]KAF7894707.1 hypothetical protein EAF01_010157 [Botrytis porri]TGO90270.1 hypothetical protein BPOR_0071g00020 [Botrytis porri]
MEFPFLPLKDGNSIPLMGFGIGTARYKEDPENPLTRDLFDILKATIERHFRHIDVSNAYGTEKELDYVDLYLLHSPYLAKKPSSLQQISLSVEQVKASGRGKYFRVSNHQRPHIEEILKVATIMPVLNQLEFHSYLQCAHEYLPWRRAYGVEVTGFNGLTPITKARPGPLDDIIAEIAARHQVPGNAVLISWQIAQNVVVTTTTTKFGRLEDCAVAVQPKLSREEQEKITQVGLTHHFRA